MMKLLVIGASGFIGLNILKVAREKNIRAIGTANRNSNNGLISYNMQADNIMDIMNQYELRPIDTYVVVCAAISKIDQCFVEKKLSYQINVEATRRLMNELHENQYKFLFISSDAVFNGEMRCYTEVDKCNANTEYGRQKAEIERYILEYMPENIVLRIGPVIDEVNRNGNLLSRFYEKVQNNETIYCMKNRVFTPIYVGDLSQIIICCFKRGLKGVYHVASQEIFSMKELAELFILLADTETKVEEKEKEWFQFKDSRFERTCLATEKIQRVLNFEMTKVEMVIRNFIKNEHNFL